jgi:hypothetical protein
MIAMIEMLSRAARALRTRISDSARISDNWPGLGRAARCYKGSAGRRGRQRPRAKRHEASSRRACVGDANGLSWLGGQAPWVNETLGTA